MVKVYVAAPYPCREEAASIGCLLRDAGFVVTSTWLTENDELNDEFARKDLSEVAAADVLLAYNPKGWGNIGTGGRHVELGYALALNKRIILVGSRTNIFHHLAHVEVFKTSYEAVQVLTNRMK